MNIAAVIKRVMIGIGALLLVQTTTYFTFAHLLLKDRLMHGWADEFYHLSDSVFVRDFYVADCYVGDDWIPYVHHLARNEDKLKQRLGVNFVTFGQQDDRDWHNADDGYKLSYWTWTGYDPPWSIYGLFRTWQVERVCVRDKYYYEKRETYQWILFFWVKTDEVVLRENFTSASVFLFRTP
jgi:hypothetical protein